MKVTRQTKVVYSRCILWNYSSFLVWLVDTAYCAGFVSTNWRKLAWHEERNTNLAPQWKSFTRVDRTAERELWKCKSVLKRISLYSDENLFRNAVKRKMLCSESTSWCSETTFRRDTSTQKIARKDGQTDFSNDVHILILPTSLSNSFQRLSFSFYFLKQTWVAKQR